MLGLQAQGPVFIPWWVVGMGLGMVEHAYNPGDGLVESGGCLELTGQPN